MCMCNCMMCSQLVLCYVNGAFKNLLHCLLKIIKINRVNCFAMLLFVMVYTVTNIKLMHDSLPYSTAPDSSRIYLYTVWSHLNVRWYKLFNSHTSCYNIKCQSALQNEFCKTCVYQVTLISTAKAAPLHVL